MLRHTKSILTIALLTTVIGCAVQKTAYQRYQAGEFLTNFPYKSGATRQSTDRIITSCQIEAAQRVPQHIVVKNTPSYTTPVQTYCNQIGTQTFCNSTGGDTYGGQTYSTDANTGLRAKAVLQCMNNNGYRYVNIPPCPKGTTPAHLEQSQTLRPLSKRTCYLVLPNNSSFLGNLKQ